MAGVGRTLAGPVFGSVLLLIASPFVLDTENFDFVILRPRELNVARFSALFLAFGVLMVWMRAMLDRWLPQAAMEGPVTFGRLVWLFSGLSPLMWFVPRALATRLPRIGAGELALGVYVGLVAFGALLTAFFLGIFFEDSEGTGGHQSSAPSWLQRRWRRSRYGRSSSWIVSTCAGYRCCGSLDTRCSSVRRSAGRSAWSATCARSCSASATGGWLSAPLPVHPHTYRPPVGVQVASRHPR